MRTSKLVKVSVVTILMAMLCSFVFSSCKNVNIDDKITINEINATSTKVAEGYIQSIFTGDEEMFYACFPEGNDLKEKNAFAQYDLSGEYSDTYLGVKYVNFNKLNDENGYDEAYVRQSISLIFKIAEADIEEMEIVKLDVCFDGETNKNYDSVSVYVIVFRMPNNNWYAFEIQNDGAEFEA